MKKILEKGKNAFNSSKEKILAELESGMDLVKDVVDGLPVWVSLERVKNSTIKYDEKHYFVIPSYLSEIGFSLHTMRSLPPGAPEINDLPKRRVFHFPNEHYEGSLRKHMLSSARDITHEKNSELKSSLEQLADDIDAFDSKLTYGMLIVGGVAAIFNPLIGAGIAAKAVLPSITGMFTKYGLRPAGEKLTKRQIEKEAREAENKVLKQFSDAETIKVINPILQTLELALRTNEAQLDPLFDPNLSSLDIPELDSIEWRELTERAIFHVYSEVIADPNQYEKAKLGPEDIRWLNVMFESLEP